MRLDRLHLWLRGEALGEIEVRRDGRPTLRFTGDATTRYGVGARPLSLSLPLQHGRIEGRSVESFLDGLLPEGAVREQLDDMYGTRTAFELLAYIGAECAGAVQFTRDDSPPGTGSLMPLTDAEVADLVVALPTLDPPGGQPLTASLGGVQAKLLLARTPDGWAWPADGAVSTHIVKPQPYDTTGVQHLVHAEHWAMSVATAVGLSAAVTELAEFAGRPAIVVERFDRRHGIRTHQEDFAQALGLAPSAKYEGALAAEPRLRRVASSAAPLAASAQAFRVRLAEQVTFNAIIGNGDAHSKNYSLTIDENAFYGITPLYDVAPVLHMGPYHHAGHAIDGLVDLRLITRPRLIREAEALGLPARRAAQVVGDVIDRTVMAIDRVPVPNEIDWLPERVRSRLSAFAGE
ncbi:MAG: HipA domain-containing protein [Microbacteriaceae bacterium]|nr:HipA domain-containing protein [Microbacteriaceae bacterium]